VSGVRIFAVSDLHTDFRENRRLLERIPAAEHRGDALIVAGDVADSLEVLAETLGFLRGRFGEVFFVPGNHELWVRGREGDSLEKLRAVLATCEAAGVRTRPARAGGAWVVPLFAWYHADFDVRGEAVEAELEGWADTYLCRWPAGLGRLDRHFLAMNEPHLVRYDGPVVSFSHFVPRPDLVPPVRWLRFKGLPRVAGSEGIEAQVRRLGAAVHVYGHTHIAGDRVIDGVRYVQHWLRAGEPLLKEVWAPGGLPPENALPLFC
jgi:predicted phosphodiesterase